MHNEKYYAGGRPIAVIDLETDPFQYDRVPEPFSSAFYNGETYIEFWGDDCVTQLYDYLSELPEQHTIYAHNGGKFDFMYFFEQGLITDNVTVISGRIVKADLCHHEIRDSFSIIPVGLAAYQKDEINYEWFEKHCREKYKKEILAYLATDCEYLFELVCRFIDRFGLQLTIGSTALKELRKYHQFEKTNAKHDEIYRPYYFGGRVECFKKGIHKGDYFLFDVNSMYPYVMANYQHPTGIHYLNITSLKNAEKYPFYFIHFTGCNRGALPMRTKDGLDFNCNYGEFFTTSHELRVALKYNLIDIDQVHNIAVPSEFIQFDTFINSMFQEKVQAENANDKAWRLFVKLCMNSSYGKFGQNPDHFYDWFIYCRGVNKRPSMSDGWEPFLDSFDLEVWRRPAEIGVYSYNDVATAASITSAARAVLLEAKVNAIDPLYCDTDSLIARGINNVPFDESDLGAWSSEPCDVAAIAGKKLYALYYQGKNTKLSTKGVRLTEKQVLELIKGKHVTFNNPAPSFSMRGGVKFISRTVKMM